MYNLRREAAAPHLAAGAIWADTPRHVAEVTEIVFTSLPGPVEVEHIALGEGGLLAGMQSGGAYFDLSINALRLAHKDVSLATALGRELHVPMPMANLALDELTTALNREWGERDSQAAMLLQQERADVHIAVDPERLREAVEREGKPKP